MIKRWLVIHLLVPMSVFAVAQQMNIDSLVREANIVQNDTLKLVRMRAIARIYAELNPDSAYYYAEKALTLARQLQLRIDEGASLHEMSYAFLNQGNYPRSLQSGLSALGILDDPASEANVLVGNFPGDDALNYRVAPPRAQRLSELAFTHQVLGILYANSNNYEKAWHHHLVARQNAIQSGNIPIQGIVELTFNRVYLNLKKSDSALTSIQRAHDWAMQSGYKRYLGSVLLNMGRTYATLGDTSLANDYYRKSLVVSGEHGYHRGVVASSLLLADYYTKSGKHDSAFQYMNRALSGAKNLDAPDLLLRVYTALTHYYRNTANNDSVVKYQALIIQINDSRFNTKQAQQFQNIDFDAQQRKEEIMATRREYQNRMQKYFLIGGLGSVLIVAIILFLNNKQKQKTNSILNKTLSELKSTQAQLIQSEKMASLGELTAGIAHEIQNPLNFVNNFSEINDELLQELKAEADKGNLDEVKAIAKDIEFNSEKINHHGKRADAIVKGMLQHSRTSTGLKEPTDLNALADEYLRLAYLGLKAKDKSFNSTIKTELDTGVGKINVNPQDMARVMLNLINNAFYAVNEKQKQQLNGYEPTVIVSTERHGGKVEIRVKDNGNGIPQQILDKIFQPFFTTKPTGQGTGLGLSLSYDIVTAQGGELKVETKEGEGSEFIIIMNDQDALKQ